MPRRSLLWQLVPSYLLITILVLAGISLYVLYSGRALYQKQVSEVLTAKAWLVESQLRERLGEEASGLDELCRHLSERSGVRITLVMKDGTVLTDSHHRAESMDNHATRPELVKALAGTVGQSSRFSTTLNQSMLYVAVPIMMDGQVLASVRTSRTLKSVRDEAGVLIARVSAGFILLALLSFATSLVVSRRIGQPLKRMTRAAEDFARGDFTGRIPVPESEELAQLADAMNWMAEQLDEKLQMIQRQRNEQEAVLASMAEGVLAVDRDQKVINVNGSLAKLLSIDAGLARGRPIMEVVRNLDLQTFITRTLEAEAPIEGTLLLRDKTEHYFNLYGAPLSSPAGHRIGALVVMDDITRMHRLETMRKDFVANVSHELKTPITSIKGFVETLQDGALDEPEHARKFLDIIARQSERLTWIINDLLSLSRMEQEDAESRLNISEVPVQSILLAAAEMCRHRADKKETSIEVICPDGLKVAADADLLEQAITNLVSNAVKYSPGQTCVEVEALAVGRDIEIRVKDQGPGIAREHVPRLFERFYRVDKARSREMGGTGLGLAIVKHVAQAHHGTVRVNSRPGHGSTFTVRIPRSNQGENKNEDT